MSDTDRLNNDSGPPDGAESHGGDGDASPPQTEREAYFQALRIWIQQAQLYQNLSSCFPYYMMTFQGLQNNPTNVPLLNNNYQFQGQHLHVPNFPRNLPGNLGPAAAPNRAQAVPNRAQAVPLSAAEVIGRHGGYEYQIPTLHKRFSAEIIDFLLLFFLKLLVTFVAVDMFELVDLEKFDFYKLSEHYDDYKYAIELTSEILFLEIIYRILVCIFEACCLSGSPGRTGGATPGKALMGLRVVTASAVVPIEGRPRETVLLYPGSPLSFPIALARSIMKNFLISLLFPMCVVLFVFKHNRTGYDLLCGVIVVEENMYPNRRNAP